MSLAQLSERAWPTAVAASFVMGLLRVNPTAELLHPYAWLLLQTLPLLVATAVMLLVPAPGPVDRRLKWVGISTAALTALCAASTLWSVTPFRSLTQSALMALAWLFLFVTAARRWVGGVRRADLALLFWLGGAAVLVGVVLRLLPVHSTVGVGYRLQGVAGNPNYLGMLLTVVLALVAVLLVKEMSARETLAVSMVSGVAVVALLWSGSRGSLLAVALAAGVALTSTDVRQAICRSWRSIIVGLLAGGVVCSLAWVVAPFVEPPEATTAHMQGELSGSDSLESMFDRGTVESGLTTGRAVIWKESLRIASERPVAGFGYRTSEVASDGNLTAHNIFISYLLETGAIGVLVFMAVVMTLLWAGWTRHPLRTALLAGCMAIALQEQVEASRQSFTGPVAMMQWLLVFGFAASGASARHGDVEHDPRVAP